MLGSGSGSVRGAHESGAVIDEGQHGTCVDSWLERSAKDLPPPVLWRLFSDAFGVLWTRTETTLGEVTLTAIAERVLHSAAEKFPFLSALRGEANGRIQFRELDVAMLSVDAVELGRGIRFVLTEFLTVLGNLTAEILTPELHAALSSVALPRRPSGEGTAPDRSIHETDGKREGERP
jgi:hypothetical protein